MRHEIDSVKRVPLGDQISPDSMVLLSHPYPSSSVLPPSSTGRPARMNASAIMAASESENGIACWEPMHNKAGDAGCDMDALRELRGDG